MEHRGFTLLSIVMHEDFVLQSHWLNSRVYSNGWFKTKFS